MKLSKNEWEELNRIRKEISNNIQSVPADMQERFTELFVRSLSYVK